MQLFYSPDLAESHRLTPEESQHCIKVLRRNAGALIRVTDGKGMFYECRITDANPKSCGVEIIKVEEESRRKTRLHIAIAPTKSGERIDWFIEKAVEFGADAISFIDCAHSERGKVNLERCERIAIAAMKQSLRATLPLFTPLKKFNDFILQYSTDHETQKIIGYCGESDKKNISSIAGDSSVICCIGPEGDFTDAEIKASRDAGFVPVEIGNRRLRTETAAIAVCAWFYFSS
jgi:16S rRNA (uracil1498-N3)-methyltransferase